MKCYQRNKDKNIPTNIEKVPTDNLSNNYSSMTPRKYEETLGNNSKRIGNRVYRTNPIKAYKLKGVTAKGSGKVSSSYGVNPERNMSYYHRRPSWDRLSGIGTPQLGNMTPTDIDPRILASSHK